MDDRLRGINSAEQAYCVLRSIVLSGDGPQFVLPTHRLAHSIPLDRREARGVIFSLAADRYFDDRRSLKGRELTRKRALDWFDTFCCYIEGALLNRTALSSTAITKGVAERIARYQELDPEAELSVMLLVDLFGYVLSAAAPVTSRDLASEIIPPAFFRILWISDTANTVRGAVEESGGPLADPSWTPPKK